MVESGAGLYSDQNAGTRLGCKCFFNKSLNPRMEERVAVPVCYAIPFQGSYPYFVALPTVYFLSGILYHSTRKALYFATK